MRRLAIILMLLLPLSALAQQEESDRGYIQSLLEDALSAPGRTVRLDGFEGALSSRATIETITVTDPEGIWLQASDVALSWRRTALLSGALEISEISVGTLKLPRKPVAEKQALPTPEASGDFTLPDLPVSVDIAKMQIKETILGEALFGEAARAAFTGKASLNAQKGTVSLSVKRLDKAGQFGLEADFGKETRILNLDLTLDEPADGIAANMLNLPDKPSVELEVKGNDPIDNFNAEIRLSTDGAERLSGSVSLERGEDGATRFDAILGGDLTPILAPDFAEFYGDDLNVETTGTRMPDGSFQLDRLKMETAALRLDGTAALAAGGWPKSFTFDASFTPPNAERVVLPLPGARTSVSGGKLTARFDAETGDSWQIDGRLDDLRNKDVSIDTALFSAFGTILQSPQSISGDANLKLDGLAATDPSLNDALGAQIEAAFSFGWSKRTPLRLSDIALEGADFGLKGAMTISGLIGPNELTVVPDLSLNAGDVSRFSGLAERELSGQASLAIRGQFKPLSGRLALIFEGETKDLTAGVARLDPLLEGEGNVFLDVTRDESGVKIRPLRLSTRHARIEASANLRSKASTINATANVIQIARVLPSMKGPAEFVINAMQEGTDWTVEASSVLPGETRAKLSAIARDTREKGFVVDGSLKADTKRLSGFSDLADRQLSGAASISAQGEISLKSGAFDITADGWTERLSFGAPAAAPLFQAKTNYTLSAFRDEKGLILLRDFKLASPALNAIAEGRVKDQNASIDFQLGLSNLSLLVPDLAGAAQINGTADQNGNLWSVDANGTGPGGIALRVNGNIDPQTQRADARLTGRLPLALANRRLKGQALSGMAEFDFSLSGPLALSALAGRVSIAQARFAAPSLNVALEELSGQAELSNGSAQLSLTSRVASGGRLEVTGPISLSAPYRAALDASFQSVTLREPTLMDATFSGRAAVNGPLAGGARISGAFDVETANLRIAQFGPSYSALEGLRHLNPSPSVQRTLRYSGLSKPAPVQTAQTAFPIDLTIRAPSRVFVRGRGVDAELGGVLRLSGTTDNVRPTGMLELIRGRFDVLRRRLEMTEGTVRLRGSFDPVIAFAAVSRVEDVSVFLRLDGLASAPDLTVTSNPQMPQEEALSFFLFGRDITNISAYQAVQLAAAIRTLSGRGGIGLVGRLRETIGVDDLDLGTDADGTAQARVGKYIADNIYSDVTIKSDGESQINLNLQVSPNVKLQGKLGSDGETSLGIFFEKDY